MYETILVPVDAFDKEDVGALLRAAADLASDSTKIVCLTVIERPPAFALAALSPEVTEQAKEKAKSDLEETRNELGIRAEISVQTGQPAQSILSTASSLGADLIVIGAHRRDLEDFLLGSTAARIVRHAASDVLVKRLASNG